MRKNTINIILLIFIILLFICLFIGIKIGNFKILSASAIKEKNNEVNDRINRASVLTSIDYSKATDDLDKTYENFKIEKQKYQEVSGLSEDSDEAVFETKKYDIGYLWKTIGKYATSHNLSIGIDVQKTNSQDNLYTLVFTVKGQYVNISEFISDIENDSDLNFRIYNFKMSGEGEIITSSFSIKDINIDPDTIISTEVKTEENNEENNNENQETNNNEVQ